MAHRGNSAVLLTGDLAFLHDSNGLLVAAQLQGSLTVVLVNNDGGGIFEHLPVASMGQTFEQFFTTPQTVQIDTLCKAYGIAHQRVRDWDSLVAAISVLPTSGVRVIEVPTDRKADKLALSELLSAI